MGANKRKQTFSPLRDKSSKKTKDNKVSAPPKVQQSNSSSSAPTSLTSAANSSQQVHVDAKISQQAQVDKQIKPIFIKSNIAVVKNVINAAQLSCRPVCKVRSTQSTQVSCLNAGDKKKLIEKLKSQRLGYHTFTDPSEKPRCFVLKGFYHTSCQNLLKLLNDEGVNAFKVTDLVRKDEFVMFLVHFQTPTSVNINQLNHDFRTIDCISVKWENLRKSNNKVSQCFNCQEWGHTSINCGYETRCVKCTDIHPIGKCPRTTREGDAKCCNCGGSHSANHRGCEVYKKHIEKFPVRRHRPAIQNRQHPASIDSAIDFPNLSNSSPSSVSGPASPHVSFAQKVKESNSSTSNPSNLFAKLTAAQNKLRSLPNIDKSIDLFVAMVEELSMFDDDESRLAIFMKYSHPNFIPLHGN